MSFRHILFPVDFSPRCYGAVPFVRALATRYKAAVTLVHVVEPPPSWASADGGYVAVLEGRGVLRLAAPLLARFFSTMADRAAAGLRATLA